MSGFDPTNPTDNSVVSAFPANERAQRLATEDIMDEEHIAAAGATAGHHRFMRTQVQSASPTTGVLEVAWFCKNVAGVPCAFLRIGALGIDIQLTTPLGEQNISITETNLEPNSITAITSIFSPIFNGASIEVVPELIEGELVAVIDWSLGTAFHLTLSENIDAIDFDNVDEGVSQSIVLEIENEGAYTIAAFRPRQMGQDVFVPVDRVLQPEENGVTAYGCTVFTSGHIHVFPVPMELFSP